MQLRFQNMPDGRAVFLRCNDSGDAFQIGLYNGAYDVQGLQIGIINTANKMQGLQIGVVNVISNSDVSFLLFDE